MFFLKTIANAAFCQATLSACLLLSVSSSQASTESTLCADLSHLLVLSKSGFYAIQSDIESTHGGLKATKLLEEAEYCAIYEDTKKRSYKCTWSYVFGADSAYKQFEQVANNISECLGSRASRQLDQPVNHPDTYLAFLYTLADTELRVTLKDKSELETTLVSVIIEGKFVPL